MHASSNVSKLADTIGTSALMLKNSGCAIKRAQPILYRSLLKTKKGLISENLDSIL